MNLIVNWISPSPYPGCNFDIAYRRNYDTSYLTLSTSGTTSGGTRAITIAAPACLEGYITADCCNNNLSEQVPFGVNAYVQVSIAISVITNNYTATINSLYGNPYPTLLTGSFRANGSLINYSATYAANSTSGTVTLATATSGSTITDISISSIAPVFDQGGALQQYDSVSTPPYFQFVTTQTSGNTSGQTSAVTWTGTPLTLPSFVLRSFIVTAQSPQGDPLAGNLLISWIATSVYGSGISPYNETLFKVYDPDSSLMGTAPVLLTDAGFLTAVIPISKVTATLGPGSQFTMKTFWGDGSLSSTKLFYLPLF